MTEVEQRKPDVGLKAKIRSRRVGCPHVTRYILSVTLDIEHSTAAVHRAFEQNACHACKYYYVASAFFLRALLLQVLELHFSSPNLSP